ncbi:type VII secretion protein EccB [Saccharopolyspora indica]|uniref:type VII secretion protein EccB n=1 Tax=Saccharopolyspora indica TaxID=1229659 RepID=UPI0022EAEAA8|nr:type VII secretion protein EccB [Saccharopolyspora indica]MDA3648596.1 type VII secretion protein EccB [Saccharopolyspora indica]
MANRRDQLHAYQFMMQRVVSALMVRETDPELTPLRRGVGAAFAGVMVMVLVAAGFGVYGVFTGIGGNAWQAEGAVVVERETGASYVYRQGALQPTLNFASAKLVAGKADAKVHRVSGKTLAGVPRRAAIGIPGAPDSLPEAKFANKDGWTMCSVPGNNPAGGHITTSTLFAGGSLAGGTPLEERAVLARDTKDHMNYLIWRNHRYRIVGSPDDSVKPEQVIRAIFGPQAVVLEAGTAWLNGLPAGQDIAPIAVDDFGAPSTVLPGHEVGDLVHHPIGPREQYYLVRPEGIAPLTELQVRIVRGQYPVEPVAIAPSVANSAPVSDALAAPSGESAKPADVPELAPAPVSRRDTLCARTSDAAAAPEITVGGNADVLDAGIRTSAETSDGTKLADQVLVPPGTVVIVRAKSSATDPAGAYQVVTDLGLRFPVPSEEVLALLGYTPADAVSMPAELVKRIPAGPTLDPAAALQDASALP